MLSFTYGLPESALDTVEGVTPRATAISLIVVADIVKNKSWKHPGFQDKYKHYFPAPQTIAGKIWGKEPAYRHMPSLQLQRGVPVSPEIRQIRVRVGPRGPSQPKNTSKLAQPSPFFGLVLPDSNQLPLPGPVRSQLISRFAQIAATAPDRGSGPWNGTILNLLLHRLIQGILLRSIALDYDDAGVTKADSLAFHADGTRTMEDSAYGRAVANRLAISRIRYDLHFRGTGPGSRKTLRPAGKHRICI